MLVPASFAVLAHGLGIGQVHSSLRSLLHWHTLMRCPIIDIICQYRGEPGIRQLTE
jgi:hypothetical protein